MKQHLRIRRIIKYKRKITGNAISSLIFRKLSVGNSCFRPVERFAKNLLNILCQNWDAYRSLDETSDESGIVKRPFLCNSEAVYISRNSTRRKSFDTL